MVVRRTSLLKSFGLLLAAVALVAVASWIWLKSLELRRWKDLEQRVARLGAQADARCGPRPVLRGAPVPGNAWDDYLPAIEAVPTHEEWLDLDHQPAAKKHSAAVDAMRRGTRRAESRRIRIHERGPDFSDLEGGWPSRIMVLGCLAVEQAKLLTQDAKHGEAAGLLLDVCKYSQDVMGDGSYPAYWLGMNIASEALQELQSLMSQGRLSAEDCLALEPELAHLDAALPGFDPVILNLVERIGAWILSGHDVRKIPTPTCMLVGGLVKPGWRYGYSQAMQLVASFDETEALLSRLLQMDKVPFSEAKARLTGVEVDRDATKTPYVRVFLEHLPDPDSHRSLRTKFRLLRIAARYAADGSIPELKDPYGAIFSHELAQGLLSVWSARYDYRIYVPRRP